jgi:hypothetical protein
MVLEDFIVTYEVDCNPQTNSCFVGCEDENCTQEYYYNLVTRRSTEINLLCGDDITDCEAALTCTSDETACKIEYCDKANETSQCTQLGSKENI